MLLLCRINMEEKRRRLKREGKPYAVEEDDPIKFKIAVNILTMKLFADLERKWGIFFCLYPRVYGIFPTFHRDLYKIFAYSIYLFLTGSRIYIPSVKTLPKLFNFSAYGELICQTWSSRWKNSQWEDFLIKYLSLWSYYKIIKNNFLKHFQLFTVWVFYFVLLLYDTAGTVVGWVHCTVIVLHSTILYCEYFGSKLTTVCFAGPMVFD